MNPYWITFKDGSKGCCEGQSEFDAMRIASHFTGKIVMNAAVLPYPGGTILWQFEHPVLGITPAFCTSPEKCKGRTSCPKPYACSE